MGPVRAPGVCDTSAFAGSSTRIYVDSVKNGERRVEWRKRVKEHELREAGLSRGCGGRGESEAERRKDGHGHGR